MDAIDRKIIRVLQQDGRLSNQELADRVGLSPSPCLRRVRKLEDEGIITGYTALVDHDKYGLALSVFIHIRLERHSDDCIKSFENGIADLDEVMECYLMTGTSDYLLHVVSENLKSWIDKNDIDILVMLTHKRSVLESIFNRSMTKKMSYNTEIPLLAIPV